MLMHTRRKLLLIMNPRSGVMLAPKYLSELIVRFSKAGFLTQVLMTTARGDARNFAEAVSLPPHSSKRVWYLFSFSLVSRSVM